jgi:hypothetical protein
LGVLHRRGGAAQVEAEDRARGRHRHAHQGDQRDGGQHRQAAAVT